MDFNLQQYLADMRKEQREDLAALRQEHRDDHDELIRRVDTVSLTLNNHHGRLIRVESTRKNLLWLAGTMIAAALTAACDLVVHHLPKLFK